MVERLTAKVGPLPVWAWALILFVGAVLALRFTRTSSDSGTSDAATPAPTTGMSALDQDTTPVGMDTGSPPAASGQGSSADNMNDALYGQLAGVQTSIDMLTAQVQTSPAFWSTSDAGFGAIIPADGSKAPVANTVAKTQTAAAPTKVQAAKAPAKQPTTPTKFYTYKPGNAPKGKKAQEAPARGPAGTSLKFRAGRGYYYG